MMCKSINALMDTLYRLLREKNKYFIYLLNYYHQTLFFCVCVLFLRVITVKCVLWMIRDDERCLYAVGFLLIDADLDGGNFEAESCLLYNNWIKKTLFYFIREKKN